MKEAKKREGERENITMANKRGREKRDEGWLTKGCKRKRERDIGINVDKEIIRLRET